MSVLHTGFLGILSFPSRLIFFRYPSLTFKITGVLYPDLSCFNNFSFSCRSIESQCCAPGNSIKKLCQVNLRPAAMYSQLNFLIYRSRTLLFKESINFGCEILSFFKKETISSVSLYFSLSVPVVP